MSSDSKVTREQLLKGAAAAFGFALLMVFAIAFHVRAGDGLMPSEPGGAGWAPAAFVFLLAALTGVLILV